MRFPRPYAFAHQLIALITMILLAFVSLAIHPAASAQDFLNNGTTHILPKAPARKTRDMFSSSTPESGDMALFATGATNTHSKRTLRAPDPATKAQAVAAYSKLPLSFEANRGQLDPQVKFLSRAHGHEFFLTPTEAVLVLSRTAQRGRPAQGGSGAKSEGKTTQAILRMKPVGGNAQPQVFGLDELPNRTNIFTGSAPENWRADVPHYGKVKYQAVYDGVDIVFYGVEDRLKYDVIVAPGADPGVVAFDFTGAKRIKLTARGDLLIETAAGQVRQPKPYIYQQTDDGQQSIPGRYVLRGKNQVGFAIGKYDTSKPLVIDPEISYSTDLGGNGLEGANDIAVDAEGNVYVIGSTNSTNFPTKDAYSDTLNTLGNVNCTGMGQGPRYCDDVFVAKMDATLGSLVYSTYLGGQLRDTGIDIAVDDSGNAYVTGRTSSQDFPMVNPAFPTFIGENPNAFVAKLSPTGQVIYSTYYGDNSGAAIAADAAGNAYVPSYQGGVSWIDKLNPSGSSILYSTSVAGGIFSIATDAAGNIYVAGAIETPTCDVIPHLRPYLGETDIAVSKLDQTGAVVYCKLLGGSGFETGYGIAADADGNAYVVGSSNSTDYPTTANAFQPDFSGGTGTDVFITKLNSTGTSILYSSYLGGSVPYYGNGSTADVGYGIDVDAAGRAYLTGSTSTADFPITPDAQWDGGGSFFAVVDTNKSGTESLFYSTHIFGGASFAVAADHANGAYIAGGTSYASYYTTPGAFQPIHQPYTDGFITRFDMRRSMPPLIFIPGIAGSRLDEEASDGARTNLWPSGVLSLTKLQRLSLDPSNSPLPKIVATDAVHEFRRVVGRQVYPVYGPLLGMLGQAGYKEYKVDEMPERRTTSGCDCDSQRLQDGERPDLFVFAYDWRLSVEDNVEKLKDFIGCVRRFHPSKKVNILAHSMGGLLARRYILDNIYDHRVDKVITIGTPWLGAPKAIDVMETGRFFGNYFFDFVHRNSIKHLALYSKGVHELLPSYWYFNLGKTHSPKLMSPITM